MDSRIQICRMHLLNMVPFEGDFCFSKADLTSKRRENAGDRVAMCVAALDAKAGGFFSVSNGGAMLDPRWKLCRPCNHMEVRKCGRRVNRCQTKSDF